MAYSDYIKEGYLEDLEQTLLNVSQHGDFPTADLKVIFENEFDVLQSNNPEISEDNKISMIQVEGNRYNPHFVLMDDKDKCYGDIIFDSSVDKIEDVISVVDLSHDKELTQELEEQAEVLHDVIDDIDGKQASLDKVASIVNEISEKSYEKVDIPKDAFEAPKLQLSTEEKEATKQLARDAHVELASKKLLERRGEIKDAMKELDKKDIELLSVYNDKIKEAREKGLSDDIASKLSEELTMKRIVISMEKETLKQRMPSVWRILRTQLVEKVQDSTIGLKIQKLINTARLNLELNRAAVVKFKEKVIDALDEFNEKASINLDTALINSSKNFTQLMRAQDALSYYTNMNARNSWLALENVVDRVFEKESQIKGMIKDIGHLIKDEELERNPASYTKLQEKVLEKIDDRAIIRDEKAEEAKDAYSTLRTMDKMQVGHTVRDRERMGMKENVRLSNAYANLQTENIENVQFPEHKLADYKAPSPIKNKAFEERADKAQEKPRPLSKEAFLQAQREKRDKSEYKDIDMDMSLEDRLKILRERRDQRVDRKTKQQTHKARNSETRDVGEERTR